MRTRYIAMGMILASTILTTTNHADDFPASLTQFARLRELDKVEKAKPTPIDGRIRGKWEVVSVVRDGEHQHGEVGQNPGDVITIEMQADSLVFS